jgi:hypothetical protein
MRHIGFFERPLSVIKIYVNGRREEMRVMICSLLILLLLLLFRWRILQAGDRRPRDFDPDHGVF